MNWNLEPLGKQPVKGEYYHSYIGNIMIPSTVDRDEFVQHCIDTYTVLVKSVDNMVENSVMVGKSAMLDLVFPSTSGSYGSLVQCITDPVTKISKVVAVFSDGRDGKTSEENHWKIYKTNDSNFSTIDLFGNDGTFNIITDSTGSDGKSSIVLLNENNRAILDVLIQGILDINVDDIIYLKTEKGFDVLVKDNNDKKTAETIIKYEAGSGFTLSDEFKNTIKTTKDGIFFQRDSTKMSLKEDDFVLENSNTSISLDKRLLSLKSGLSELSLSSDGFVFEKGSTSLHNLLSDLIDVISQLTVIVPQGTGVLNPATIANLQKIKFLLPTLFKV